MKYVQSTESSKTSRLVRTTVFHKIYVKRTFLQIRVVLVAPALVVIPDLREIQINSVQNLLPVVAAPLLHYVVAAISLFSNDDHHDFGGDDRW